MITVLAVVLKVDVEVDKVVIVDGLDVLVELAVG